MIRKCRECDWYTVIETAQGRHITICADENGGCFLQETSILGWCGEEEDTQERILLISKEELDHYRELMQAKSLDLGKLGLYRYSTVESWSVDFGGGYAIDLKVCSSGLTDPLWCEAVLFLNGCECGCTDVEDDLLGDWDLQDGDNRFILKVMEGSEDGIA